MLAIRSGISSYPPVSDDVCLILVFVRRKLNVRFWVVSRPLTSVWPECLHWGGEWTVCFWMKSLNSGHLS